MFNITKNISALKNNKYRNNKYILNYIVIFLQLILIITFIEYF